MLDLASGDLYSGIRGKGAFRNGEPIHVADVPPENALVVFGTSPYYPELADTTFAMAKELCTHWTCAIWPLAAATASSSCASPPGITRPGR